MPDHADSSYCLAFLKRFIPAIASPSADPCRVLEISSVGDANWTLSTADWIDFVVRLASRHDANYHLGAFADPDDLLQYFLSIVPGVAHMCEINSKTIVMRSCSCRLKRGETLECEHGIMTSVNSDDPLSSHILKLFDPVAVCDFHCEQCGWRSSAACPATMQRLLLSFPRFLRVNVILPPTSEGVPADFHQHGPLQAFERLNLSQLIPQLQSAQGQYVLRAAIMYSQAHHWTYLHGQSPIYVSDDISRLATPEDLQEVAL